MSTTTRLHITFLSALAVTAAVVCSSQFKHTDARDALNPNGNITVKWDVISWTPDGYVASVTIFNFHSYRIRAPGWTLGWTWAKNEVIWHTAGATVTEPGDCSRFKGAIPLSCVRDPAVVDMPPGTPRDLQVANCCKGGVMDSWWSGHPENAAASFQVSVGMAGTTTRAVRMPKNSTFIAPGRRYACGPAKAGRPTLFFTKDRRRVTQAIMTWNVICKVY